MPNYANVFREYKATSIIELKGVPISPPHLTCVIKSVAFFHEGHRLVKGAKKKHNNSQIRWLTCESESCSWKAKFVKPQSACSKADPWFLCCHDSSLNHSSDCHPKTNKEGKIILTQRDILRNCPALQDYLMQAENVKKTKAEIAAFLMGNRNLDITVMASSTFSDTKKDIAAFNAILQDEGRDVSLHDESGRTEPTLDSSTPSSESNDDTWPRIFQGETALASTSPKQDKSTPAVNQMNPTPTGSRMDETVHIENWKAMMINDQNLLLMQPRESNVPLDVPECVFTYDNLRLDDWNSLDDFEVSMNDSCFDPKEGCDMDISVHATETKLESVKFYVEGQRDEQCSDSITMVDTRPSDIQQHVSEAQQWGLHDDCNELKRGIVTPAPEKVDDDTNTRMDDDSDADDTSNKTSADKRLLDNSSDENDPSSKNGYDDPDNSDGHGNVDNHNANPDPRNDGSGDQNQGSNADSSGNSDSEANSSSPYNAGHQCCELHQEGALPGVETNVTPAMLGAQEKEKTVCSGVEKRESSSGTFRQTRSSLDRHISRPPSPEKASTFLCGTRKSDVSLLASRPSFQHMTSARKLAGINHVSGETVASLASPTPVVRSIRHRSSSRTLSASNHSRQPFLNSGDFNPQSTSHVSICQPDVTLKPSTRSAASTVTWETGRFRSSWPRSSTTYQHGRCPGNKDFTRTAKEFLMVFYAAPLVYEDEKTRLIKPIGALDFKMEHNALKQSLEGTELDVMFDYATTDRLSKFLIEGRGRVLHYSGHGHAEYLVDEERWGEQYLAIENGRGKMHKLTVEDLEDWIKQGGNNLELVFVSACHSRAAGEAFVKAGVKHVVCCAHDEFEIRNDAAVEFTKAFYQALANGRTVAKAFEDGRSKVKTSSQMARVVARKEGEKFVLLPVDQNHDVMIYDLDHPPASPSRLYTHDEMKLMGEKDRGTLPRPPDFFQGRQLEMYDVLSKLEKTRIVRITGSEGIGKRSLVNALCHYILDRQHIFKGFVDHLVWLPIDFETGEVDYRPLMDDVNQEMLVRELSDSSYLLMIDARCCNQLQFVEEFLRLIISHTSTRIIVIERFENPGCFRPGLAESEVHVAPLDFQETAWLFGSHCPLVCNGNNSDVKCVKDFRSAIIPQDATVSTLHTMIGRDYYKELGGGYPKVIQERAKNMKDDHAYRRLLQLGRKHKKIVEWMQELQLYSRAQLNKIIEDTQKQEDIARSRNKLEEADTWSKKLNELEALKERFPTIESLARKSRELEIDIQLAFNQEDYITANTLSAAHIRVQHKLQTERLAIKNPQRIEPAMSHRKLQQKVESLKFKRYMALEDDDLDMAESLQNDLNRYKKLLAAKPSLAFLQELKARRLEEYKTAREHAANDDELGDISHLRDLREKLKEAVDRENAELFAQSHDDIVNDMTWYETVERCATLWQSSGNASNSEESESTLTTPQAGEHLAKAAPLAVATGFGSMAHCVGSMNYGFLKPTPTSDRGNGDYGHSKQLNDDYQHEQHGIPQFSHTVTNTRNPPPQEISHSFDSSNPFRGDKEGTEVFDSKPTHWKDRMAMEGSDRTKYLDVFRPGQELPSAPRWSKSDILFEPSTETPLTFGNKSEESLPAVMPTVKPEPSSQHSETSNSKSVGSLIPSQSNPPSQTLINTKPLPTPDVLVQNAKFPASKFGESSSGGNKKKTKFSGCNPTSRIPSPTKTLESDLKPPPATAVIFQNAEQPVSNSGDSNSVCTEKAGCEPSPTTSSSRSSRLGLQRASDKLVDCPSVRESINLSPPPARTFINLPSDAFNHSHQLNEKPGKVLALASIRKSNVALEHSTRSMASTVTWGTGDKFEEADTWNRKLKELEELQHKFPTIKLLEQESLTLDDAVQLASLQKGYVKAKVLSDEHVFVKHERQTARLAISNPQRLQPDMCNILFEPSTDTTLTCRSKSEGSLSASMTAEKQEPSSEHSELNKSTCIDRLIPNRSRTPLQSLVICTRPPPATTVPVDSYAEHPVSTFGKSSSGGQSGCGPSPTTSSSLPSRLGLQRASNKLANFPIVLESKTPSRLPANTLSNLPYDTFNRSYRSYRNPGDVLGLEMFGVEEPPSPKDLGIVIWTRHPDAEDEHEITLPPRRKDPPGNHGEDQAGAYSNTASFKPQDADRRFVSTPSTTSTVTLLGQKSSHDLIAENYDEYEEKTAAKMETELHSLLVPDRSSYQSCSELQEKQMKVVYQGVASEKVAWDKLPLAGTMGLEGKVLLTDEKEGQALSIDSGAEPSLALCAHCLPGINSRTSSLSEKSRVPVAAAVLNSEVLVEAVAINSTPRRRRRFHEGINKLMRVCLFREKKKNVPGK